VLWGLKALVDGVWAYVRKIMSFVLIFNCLLTILLVVGFLVAYYGAGWKLYEPFLLSNNLLWVPIAASMLTFFPIATFGQVKVRRLGTHHFVYGLVILAASLAYLWMSLFSLFVINSRDLRVNVGRVLMLVGLTLIVDDFADISDGTRSLLRGMKMKMCCNRRMIHAVQTILSCGTLFVFLSILVWLTQTPRGPNLANFTLEGSLLVTGLTGLVAAGKKVWLRISP
jgi:hypothetical protein